VALNPIAAELTTAHRTVQARRGAVLAYAIAKLWERTVKPANLEETTAAFMRVALALIRRERDKSASYTRVYYPKFRALEIPDAPVFEMPEAPELIREAVETSLRVTGPIAYQKKVAQIDALDLTPELEKTLLTDAFESAGKTTAAASVRHALDGGRDLMREAGKQDKLALGWARVTRDDPCYFCAMLASRGFVYGKDAFTDSNAMFDGSGVAKVHDACQCTMEPTFHRGSNLPGRGADFEAIWEQASLMSSGPKENRRAFRALLEGRPYNPPTRLR
jgi:hypothetical protein